MESVPAFPPPPIPRLMGAAAILAVSFLGSRLLGLLRDIAIGQTFGTSPELDAYYVAFRLPDTIFQLLAGAALASAFIPTFASYLARGETEGAWQVAGSSLALIWGITALLVGVGIALAPVIVPLLAPGFSAPQQLLATELTRIMLLSPLFFSLSGLVLGLLQARQHFLTPALAPWLYNLALIGGALLLSRLWGIFGLAWGVVIGAALHLLVQVPALLGQGIRYHWAIPWRHPGVREVLQLMFPRVLGLAAVQLNFVITTVLASTLASGSLAALNLAWPLMMLPLGLFGVPLAAALFPTLAQSVATGQREHFGRSFTASLHLVLFLTVPASLGLLLLGQPTVALLYQRGDFTPQSTQAVAWALLFYALGIPAHAALELITRAFYAQKDTRTPVMVGIGAMALNLGLSLVLMRWLHHGGLALSLSLATTLETLVLYLLLTRGLPDLDPTPTLRSLGRSLAASLVMSGFLLGFLRAFSGASETGSGLLLLVGGGVLLGAAVYLGSAFLLGSGELRWVGAELRGRLRRSS